MKVVSGHRQVVGLISALLSGAGISYAQQPTRIPRLGIATGNRESISTHELQRGLRELGYIEGKNIVSQYRFYGEKFERIPIVVNELVQSKVDVLVLSNFRAIRAAKEATKTVPIVMVTTQNPVEAKIVDSLARPGGNITGLTRLTRDLSGKRLELLKEVLPAAARAGMVWESRPDAETSGSAIAYREYEAAAGPLNLQLQSLDVRDPKPDFNRVLQAAKGRVDALMIIHNAFIVNYRREIADLAVKHRLPTINEGSAYVEAGGLMSYATSDVELYRRSAVYVDKILKGAKPADLPVEQASKFVGHQSEDSEGDPPDDPATCISQSRSGNQVRPSRVIQFGLAAMLLSLTFSAAAQQPQRVPLIGYVSIGDPKNPGSRIEAFRQSLRDLGYTEGKNILVEYRYLHGDRGRIPSVVTELIQLKVDVIISGTPPVMRALKQATKTVPIVMVTTQDPVAAGYVDSLARPGGNITGLTRMTRDLSEKRLELLKEVISGVSRVGLLWNADGSDAGFAVGFKRYEAAAPSLKIKLASLPVRGPIPDFDGAFRAATKERVDALISLSNIVLDPYTKRIAELAIKNKLPSMGETNLYVEEGNLISYSPDDRVLAARAAVFVDKILKGAKPADLPIEQPTKFELVINLKTAKQIGVIIPPNVLARADKVIR